MWLFDKNGVQCLDPDMHWEDIHGLSRDVSHCALVDSNQRVHMPAELLDDPSSPFFIIYASSPCRKRWHWTKYRDPNPTYHFYTKPFSLKEVLMGVSVVIALKLGV